MTKSQGPILWGWPYLKAKLGGARLDQSADWADSGFGEFEDYVLSFLVRRCRLTQVDPGLKALGFSQLKALGFKPVESTRFPPVESTRFQPVESTRFQPVESTRFLTG